jgi:CRISPR-associated endonuclease/helicase Cas3
MTYFWAKTTPDGKPGISVFDHMLNVGCVARCIAEASPKILDRFNLTSSAVGALAALHDLGKISPGFQAKCEAWLEANGLSKIARNGCWDTVMEPDHGKVSHSAIQSFLMETGCTRNTAKLVSAVLGAHHGRMTLPNERGYYPNGMIKDDASGLAWDSERMANARMISERFELDGRSLVLTEDTPALWWIAGLASVADWIGSDERFFPPERTPGSGDACSRARNALNVIDFIPPVLRDGLSFEKLFGFSPNDMQIKACSAISGPGVYIIEAPMGMGKTEAALWAAYRLMLGGKANGIYFALPTQTTSNRIHLRMDDFLSRVAPDARQTSRSRLIHGNSWLVDGCRSISPVASVKDQAAVYDALAGRDWFSSAKRALVAPFGVGTVDQALLGVVAAKHFFVRHFALAGKVVILDEIHSYDLYTGTLIDKLITTLEGLGCTVIVLSATLTGKRRGQIVPLPDNDFAEAGLPYPLITGRNEGVAFEPVAAEQPLPQEVKVDFISVADATDEAVSIARSGGTVLWICNTVGASQQQYRLFAEKVNGDFPLGLLHARFPFWRREQLEGEWMGRFGKDGKTRCGSILVSTQVVEQSVDLDADLLITELAPTDMLLQRLGRLWRHNREDRPPGGPRICILEEGESLETLRQIEPKAIKKALGKKAKVYAPYILLRSLEVWKAQPGCVTIPSQIRELIEATYEERWDEEPGPWQQLSGEWFGTDSAKKMIADRNSNIWSVQLDDKEGSQTRINEMPTLPVVLCRSINRQEAVFVDGTAGKLGEDAFWLHTAQAIQKNLVKVPRYCFEDVQPCKAFADYLYGEQSIGIVGEDGTVEVKGLKDGIRLFYSDELGLLIDIKSKTEEV